MSETAHPRKIVFKDSILRDEKNESFPNHEKRKHQGTWSGVTVFKDWWADESQRRKREKYLFTHGKDEKLIKQMLDACGSNVERLKGKAIAFLNQDDDFLRKTGHTIGMLAKRFNSLTNGKQQSTTSGQLTETQKYFMEHQQ